MRFSKCEFLDKLRIFAPVWSINDIIWDYNLIKCRHSLQVALNFTNTRELQHTKWGLIFQWDQVHIFLLCALFIKPQIIKMMLEKIEFQCKLTTSRTNGSWPINIKVGQFLTQRCTRANYLKKCHGPIAWQLL